MRSEAVVLGNSAPVYVYYLFSRLLRAYAVFPVVCVGKASARPAHDGNLYGFKRLNNVVSDTSCVGDRAVLSDVNAAVYASAEVLCKMSVNLLVDFADFIGFVNSHLQFCHIDCPSLSLKFLKSMISGVALHLYFTLYFLPRQQFRLYIFL